MKAKEYVILARAVEDGVDYGWLRAHKHADNPAEHDIKREMTEGVINAICECFEFEKREEEEE